MEKKSRFFRFIQFPLIRILIAAILVLGPVAAVQIATSYLPNIDSLPMMILANLLIGATAIVAYWGYVRLIERRTVSEIGATRASHELGLGLLIGAGLFCMVIGILWTLGYYQVDGVNSAVNILPVMMIAIAAGIVEEVLFRGILFRIFQEWLGSWIALALSAALFGAIHFFNPNASLVAVAAIAIEAGILLAAAYMLTRRLWLAIGIHIAWNFVQGGIFGVAVSGNEMSGLLQGRLDGPLLMTGGEFGAEASIVAVIACGLVGIIFIVRAVRKGHLISPFWKR